MAKFFSRLFSSSGKQFDRLDVLTQIRVSTVVGLAGFATKAVEEHLFVELTVSDDIGQRDDLFNFINYQLALGVLSSSAINKTTDYYRLWGLDESLLRKMAIRLISAGSPIFRGVAEQVSYSKDPAEASAQVLATISSVLRSDRRCVGRQDVSRASFGSAWTSFTSTFIDGTLAGMARIESERRLSEIRSKIVEMQSAQKAVVEEVSRSLAEVKVLAKRKVAEAKQVRANRHRRKLNDREEAFIELASAMIRPQIAPFVDDSEKPLAGPFLDREVCGYIFGYLSCLLTELSLNDAPPEADVFSLMEHCMRDIIGESSGRLAFDISAACSRLKEPEDFSKGKKRAKDDFNNVKCGGSAPQGLVALISKYLFESSFLATTNVFGETSDLAHKQKRGRELSLKFDSPQVAALHFAAEWVGLVATSTPPGDMVAAGGPIFRVVGGICELVIDKKIGHEDGRRYFDIVVAYIRAPISESMGGLDEVRNFDEMLRRNRTVLGAMRLVDDHFNALSSMLDEGSRKVK